MPDDSNFVRHTFREIGPIKGGRKWIQDAFEEEKSWGLAEESTKEKYWEDTNAQKLLRSIVRVSRTHKYFEPDDIKDDLNERANYPMPKTSILQLLRKFTDDCLVRKTFFHVRSAREFQFQVAQTMDWLRRYMNPNKGEIPNEEDWQCSSEKESNVTNVDSVDFFCEDVAKAGAISSSSNTDDEQSVSSMPISTTIHSGKRSSTATCITPEKLGNALTAKRKALAVFQSESSEKRMKRKKRVPYSEEEKEALLQGVDEFGEGKWKQIRHHYADTFDLNMRTAVNLKDLYRTLTK